WELKPEDFCQGPCLTDREIYRDIDSIMQKENQRREQEEFAGSFEKRFKEAAWGTTRTTRRDVWEYGLAHGLFQKSEEEAVMGFGGRKERFKNDITRAKIYEGMRLDDEMTREYTRIQGM